MIRWCIYLRYLSRDAYETTRCYISLPSQRTLRDYTHHLKPGSGFPLDKIEKRDKCVILLLDKLDKMYVKQDLVFSKPLESL